MPAAVTAPSSALLTDLPGIGTLCARLAEDLKPFCIDIETGYHGPSRPDAAKHPEEAFITSVQLTNDMSWARMIPLAFDRGGANVSARKFAALLWPLFWLTDAEGLPLAVAHGAVFEMRFLSRFFLRHLWDHPLYGRQVLACLGRAPFRSCTMIESYVEGKTQFHKLKYLTALPEPDGFGVDQAEIFTLFPDAVTAEQRDAIRFNMLDPRDPKVISYACDDVVYGLGHHLKRFPQVRRSSIYRMEMKILPIVAEMADDGLCCDWDLLRGKRREVREFMELLMAEVIEDFSALAGEPLRPDFNFGSSSQLADLLYGKCGMTATHFTDKGAPSVNADQALAGLSRRHPEVKKYLGWRKLQKLLTSYLNTFEDKYCYAPDRLAHPSLMQHGTIAGRFSCKEFNYQNLPKKYHYELRDGTVFDFNFRDFITAPPPGTRPWWSVLLEEAGAPPEVHLPPDFRPDLGWYILGGDYSQIELRVMAAEAGETALLDAFTRGDDIHRLTASKVLTVLRGRPVTLGEITDEERTNYGKRPNFAIGYGLSAQGMSDRYGMSLEEAEAVLEAWHAAYPRIRARSKAVIRKARSRTRRARVRGRWVTLPGWVVTKFGRRVTLWDYAQAEVDKSALGRGDRAAANACIQGPATGEYVKTAMIRARAALRRAGLDGKVLMVMNVHDSLDFYVRDDVRARDVIAVLQPALVFPIERPAPPWPPQEFVWHIGRRWGSVAELQVLADGRAVRARKPAPVPSAPPAPAPAAPAGRRVLVVAFARPSDGAPARLRDYLRTLPGDDAVVLSVPGETAELPGRYGLGPGHEDEVARVLGCPVAVHYDLDETDAEIMARGAAL